MSLGIHHRLPKHTMSDFLVKVVTVLDNPDVNLFLFVAFTSLNRKGKFVRLVAFHFQLINSYL